MNTSARMPMQTGSVFVDRVTNWPLSATIVAVAMLDARTTRDGATKRARKILTAALAAALFGTARVIADDRGLEVGLGPWGWPSWRIPIARIVSVRAESVRAMRSLGWGLRTNGSATRLVVRSGPGVVVQFHSGRTFGVTTSPAHEAAAVLRAALHRSGPDASRRDPDASGW